MESFKVDHPLILKQVAHTAFKLAALYIGCKLLQINQRIRQIIAVVIDFLIYAVAVRKRRPNHITVNAQKQLCFMEYVVLRQAQLLVHLCNIFYCFCIVSPHCCSFSV